MTVRSVGFVALHSCPFLALGEEKAGGMSASVLGLAREFSRRGIAVKIVTNEHPKRHQDGDCEAGFMLIHVPPAPFATASGGILGHGHEGAEEVAAALGDDCDVVHTHYWLSGRAGQDVSRRLDAPHVTTFHTIAAVKEQAFGGGSEPAERLETERSIAQDVDGIVAWTSFEAEALVSMLGADPERIAVAPIGVDAERFRPLDRREARERLGIPLDDESLLYVGRLDAIKGADVLLEAFGLLSERPQLRLRIVGGEVDADYAARLRGLASELGVADRVTWVGLAPNDELPWHYAAADVVVVPSHSESFSIVATEAMACGTPVVASNVPGPASFIEDGVSGRLVPPGDAPALAAAISELLDDGDARRRLSEGALEAARGLTWAASADAVLGLYERAGELRGGRGALTLALSQRERG